MDNLVFNQRSPHILVVDSFYKNPDNIRQDALSLEFKENENYFKGIRSTQHLLPYVKEEFERLLNVRITDWLAQPMNGVFQITTVDNPLVWHSDNQRYAAAIYLTPDGDINTGTSFWKDKKYGCRRPPNHILENNLGAQAEEIYSEYNLLHEDNWQLVDKVGAIYNRLVIWDAKLIHSASSYGLQNRLVQLFFFNAE